VKNGFNCIWRILADFLIRSGGLEKNHLATLHPNSKKENHTERAGREDWEERRESQDKVKRVQIERDR
jgi:hypothetical protein